LEHREGLLLLNFVINVQKCSLKAVVGHRVLYRLSHESEVECLVISTDLGVFEANVDVADVDAEVLCDHIAEAGQVALVRLLSRGLLQVGRELVLDMVEKLLNLGLLVGNDPLLDELAVVGASRLEDHVDIFDLDLHRL